MELMDAEEEGSEIVDFRVEVVVEDGEDGLDDADSDGVNVAATDAGADDVVLVVPGWYATKKTKAITMMTTTTAPPTTAMPTPRRLINFDPTVRAVLRLPYFIL